MMKNSKFPSVQYISFSMKHAAGYTGMLIFLRLVQALMPSVQILTLAGLLDRAQEAFAAGKFTDALYISIFLFVGFILLDTVLHIISSYVRMKYEIKIGMEYDQSLLMKKSRLIYYLTEEQDTQELVNRLSAESTERMAKGLQNLLDLFEYGIRIAGVAVIVLTAHVGIGLAVMAIFAIMLPVARKCGEEDYEAYAEADKQLRKAAYLQQVLGHRDFADERKTFAYTDQVNEQWELQYDKGRKMSQAVTKRNFVHIKAASMLTVIMAVAAAVLLLFPLRRGTMTVGGYVSVVTAIINLTKLMSWNLAYIIEDFTVCKEYVSDLHSFWQLPEIETGARGETIPREKIEKIVFQKVSFRYPGCENYVLKDMSFTLEKGKTYALVGENGAGKTTLVKLLLGLYREYEGDIYINDREIRQIGECELFSYFSVAYQDFPRYEMSLRDNLVLGRADARRVNDEEIRKWIGLLGLTDCVNRLSAGLDTEIGRLEEAGQDLSGGEWQRVAVARALLADGPIQIMDEPTAALDPVHESELFEKLISGETGELHILISHRLGGIRKASQILVVQDGRIGECGTHEELLQKNGLYAEMFDKQKRWYV